MRPDDETPRDDETPGDDETPETGPPEDAAGEQEPPPSTYAGRRRAEAGDEDAGDEDAGGGAEPDDTEDPGFTEEFDRIERELDAELDGLGGGDVEESKGTADDAGGETDAVAAEPEEEAPAAEEVPVDDEDLDEPDADEADATEDAGAGEDEAAPPAGATVEAETVTLADREEAQEAALAGLKARAGDGKAWDTTLHVAAEEDEEKPPRSGRIWPRFLAASLLIIVSMTVATSVSALVELDYWSERFHDGKLDKAAPWLTQVDAGDPQNLLILGSDERLSLPGDKRSDTTILLRVDPDQQAISLLSIPRDLKVSIPNHGIDKFNAAYSYGGPTLTLRTVENLTGVNVNHLVNINFTGFADAVDAIDCVYVDVDRRYYIPEESGVAAINVEAGYQRMCGFNALAYVRYRHDDNDLVRAARQQDFLREARQKVPPWKLWEDRKDLLTIFTDHTTSDIDSGVELLELLRTFLGARNAELREVHFPADLGDGTTGYVTASDEAIGSTVKTFLGTEGTPGPPEAGESSESAQKEAEAEEKESEEKEQRKPEEDKEEAEPDGPPMENSTDQSQKYAHQISIKKTKGGEPMVTFPIFYPTSLVPGSVITNDSRAFPIDGPDDEKYSGYKMSIQVPGQSFGNGLIYEYYGITGTNWDEPPILENPSETREIDGRTYDLFWDGDRLRLVAWHDKHDNSYWVNNTLSQSLSGEQMLQIARSMQHDD